MDVAILTIIDAAIVIIRLKEPNYARIKTRIIKEDKIFIDLEPILKKTKKEERNPQEHAHIYWLASPIIPEV